VETALKKSFVYLSPKGLEDSLECGYGMATSVKKSDKKLPFLDGQLLGVFRAKCGEKKQRALSSKSTAHSSKFL
jgi:hypothetical protein